MAHSLPSWREPDAILSLACLGIAERAGLRRADICEQLSRLRGVPERLRFFDMPRIDVSSSLVRGRVAAGRPIRYLVPDPVAAAVERAGMYR